MLYTVYMYKCLSMCTVIVVHLVSLCTHPSVCECVHVCACMCVHACVYTRIPERLCIIQCTVHC